MAILECTAYLFLFSFFGAVAAISSALRVWTMLSTPNPFARDSRRPKKPYVKDRKLRDEVLRRQFHISKVTL